MINTKAINGDMQYLMNVCINTLLINGKYIKHNMNTLKTTKYQAVNMILHLLIVLIFMLIMELQLMTKILIKQLMLI